MAGNTLKKGTVICESGQPFTAIHLITSGKVTASYPGGTYQLSMGDVIGVCEVCSEVNFITYTAAEDTTIHTYPFTNIATLDNLLRKKSDMAKLFILSACNQINTLLEASSLSELNCNSYYQSLQEDIAKYNLLCNRYRIPARSLDHIEELTAYLGEEAPDLWLLEYYMGLGRLYSGESAPKLVSESEVSIGLLRKCSLDFRRAYVVLDEQYRYLQQVTSFYFNAAGNDLFDFYTSLYYKLGADCADGDEIFSVINHIIFEFSDNTESDSASIQQRISTYEKNISRLSSTTAEATKEEEQITLHNDLVGSLNTILDFAGPDLDIAASFREHVQAYKMLPDKFSTEDDATRLRLALTKEFYTVYETVFAQTLDNIWVPAPVKMFLYFGYVDEDLAGINNATYLYNLMDTMTDHSDQGVYTFYDWLLAIYQGRKEPSRNEFEQDYSDYVHKQRASNKFTDAEIKAMENDAMAKVRYELQNLFPSVNKITYGRISIFCPLFCADNVLKSLEDSYVTVSGIAKAIEQIKKVDYSVFYRESLDKDNIDILGKEQVHFEYLPDVILMPNVGIRGSMWQEIEGKRRNSPGRMLFSIFHLEDLNLSMIRLAGEFRWELCKRIQGSRWNDISELSLTSEYFDYIQFYRKNHDLTTEAKERVRSGLQRAKNSFKEMFVRDYIVWILFEGNGSPRLNKVARRILFLYCPFPKETRNGLAQNPLYTEILTYYETKTAQKLHRLKVLTKKLQNCNQRIPDSLRNEMLYVEGTLPF